MVAAMAMQREMPLSWTHLLATRMRSALPMRTGAVEWEWHSSPQNTATDLSLMALDAPGGRRSTQQANVLPILAELASFLRVFKPRHSNWQSQTYMLQSLSLPRRKAAKNALCSTLGIGS